MRRLILLSTVALLSARAEASTSFAFLKIESDAATAALGESAGSWTTPLSTVGNPALGPGDGLVHAAISQSNWIFDSQHTALALAFPLPKGLRGGVDLRVLSSEDFERRSGAGPEPEGSFRLDDLALGVTVSGNVTEHLSGGLALRRVQEKIDTKDSKGWCGDLGLAWKKGAWTMQAAAQNLGSVSAFQVEDVTLPRTMSLAAAWSGTLPLAGWEATAQASLRHLRDDEAHPHLGLELRPAPGLSLRGGWMGGYEDRSITAGVGFAWRQARLDYGWLPFSSALDDVHRFTFSFAL